MKRSVSENEEILLSPGYSEIVIDAEKPLELTFRAAEKSEVYIRIEKAQEIRIRTETEENASVSYLFWNAAGTQISVDEEHHVKRYGALRIAYAEINQGSVKRTAMVTLEEEGAYALVSSAVLCASDKHFVVDVVSQSPHTTGIMENYAVVLEGGKYYMNATGKIVKGAYGSESHQTSRALCFDEKQSSTILPKLLIDENDVQASHATTLGRVDEDQLYYMQSRGLTQKQCTSLISTGYLMPVTRFIEDETLKTKLQEEMERKIADL